jgi:hypothetical protein
MALMKWSAEMFVDIKAALPIAFQKGKKTMLSKDRSQSIFLRKQLISFLFSFLFFFETELIPEVVLTAPITFYY